MKLKILNFLLPKNIDFTNGDLKRKIFLFTLPIALEAFLQTFFTCIDSLILVYFGGGQDAIAALGNSSTLITLIINMFAGLSSAVTILFAAAVSKKDQSACDRLIGISLFLSLIIGLTGSIVCITCARFFLQAINTPASIIELAIKHFRCYFSAFPFIILTNYFISVLWASGNSKSVLYNVLIRSVVQTSLTCLLLIAFKMDILGIGIAMAIAMIMQSLYAFWSVFLSKTRCATFKIKNIRFYKDEFIAILKIGVLMGISRFLIAFADTSLQTEIGLYGKAALAGSSVSGVFATLVLNVITSVASACLVATSQNFGVKKYQNYKSTIKYSIIIVFLIFGVIGLPIALSSPYLIAFFLGETFPTSSEEFTFAWQTGVIKLLLLVAPSFIYGIMQCLLSAHNGIKRPLIPVINVLLTSLVFRLTFGSILTLIFKEHNITNFTLLVASLPISWFLSVIASYVSLRIINRHQFNKNG